MLRAREQARLVRDGEVEVVHPLSLAEAEEVESVDAKPVGESQGDVAPEAGVGRGAVDEEERGPKPSTS